LGVEEAAGGVDGSVAAEKGECRACDVRGRKRLGTGVSGKMRECANSGMREWNPAPGRGRP